MRKLLSAVIFAGILLGLPCMAGAAASAGTQLSKLDEAYLALSAEGGANYFEAAAVCTSPLPVPSAQELTMAYEPVQDAVTSFDVGRSRPVGVGAVATGGSTVRVSIGLSPFESPVDIYFAIATSLQPDHLFVLKPDNSFEDIDLAGSSGPVMPWKGNTAGPVSTVLGSVSVSSVPPGDYIFYLLVTPTGRTNDFFLWSSELSVH